MNATCPPSAAALLRLDPRDRAGLLWVRNRARTWLTAMKRRRKYRPHQPVMDPAEIEILQNLICLERAAGELLAETTKTGD